MAQHECDFDFALLPADHGLPPHDKCYASRAHDKPTIYTLHWYRRACCVIQTDGRTMLVNTTRQKPFSDYASVQDALPALRKELK